MEKRQNKRRRAELKRKQIAAGIVLLVVLIFIIVRIFGQRMPADVKEGRAFVKTLNETSVVDVENKIKAIEKKQRVAQAEQILAKIESGEMDVWSQFGTIFWLGDSRSEALTYYGFLDEQRLYANKGDNLRKAKGGLEKAKAASPEHLLFTYGLNDVTGNWGSSNEFIEFYKSVISEYQAALPNVDIYVASIIPVEDKAVAKQPLLKNIAEYNEKIKTMCQELGYHYIDCSSLYTDHVNEYEQDGEHFKKSFYPFWAKLIIKEVLTNEANQSSGSR